MFTYGINFKKKYTMLLYPKHLLNVHEKLILGEEDDTVKLELRSLDLSLFGKHSTYIEYIEKIRSKLKGIL
jgi:hypothetical protein